MSPFISVRRGERRRPAAPVIAVLLATTVLLASFALPAFGLSPAKLLSRALSTAKKADKDAKKAEKDAKSANANALNSTVGTTRLQNGAVTVEKIAAGAVGNGQLAGNAVAAGNIIPGSIGSAALATGAVTGDKLAPGSVGNSQIVPASVSIADLSGANTNTTFDIPEVTANTCSTAEVADAAAATSDFPMISFPGPTNLPLQLSATVLRVDTAGSVRVKLCNGTGVDAAAVSGVNIEVVTLR
jgi:hypothetical protein